MSIQDAEYELFRRAVQERDSEAWTAIATQYRRLLIAWAAQCQASRMASESY